MENHVSKALELLSLYELCNHCLGRCFARHETGMSNDMRGSELRKLATDSSGNSFNIPEECPICQNLFELTESWARRAIELSKGIEFKTYLCGTHPPTAVVEAEQALYSQFNITTDDSEPFKQEYNRECGKKFGQILDEAGHESTVDLRTPHITFRIDLEKDKLDMGIRSLYFYGRYRKHSRELPQTQWPCKPCRGRGCDACNGTGKQYPESVGELIAAPALKMTIASDHAFHGAGREDIDALMLGSGRPFVLEIKKPRIRSLVLADLQAAINSSAQGKVDVGELRIVGHKVVEEVKTMKARKSYGARVDFERNISPEDLQKALNQLEGKIEQRTPSRVSHRRADLVRTRNLFSIKGEMTSLRQATIELTCDGGLYVKELISGDHKRTNPSLAALLETAAVVTELDVLDVDGKFPDSF